MNKFEFPEIDVFVLRTEKIASETPNFSTPDIIDPDYGKEDAD